METILESFKIYLFETGKITSNMTIQSYLGNIRQLLLWLNNEKIAMEALDRMIILKYLEFLREKDYKANTYNTKINSIANFNNYLKEQKLIDRDIVFGKDKIGLSGNREVDVYSDDEMKLIEEYIDSKVNSPRDALIIKMLKELGVRVSELTNLRLEDIDIVGLQVEVQGKNNKRRILPMKTDLAEDIRSYIAGERRHNKHHGSRYLFTSERLGSNPIHRNSVLDIVKTMANELEITGNCHKFRHTLATKMAKSGNVPIQVIQRFLGHVEIQTTIEFYVKVEQ